MSVISDTTDTIDDLQHQIDMLILENPERSAAFKRNLREAEDKLREARAMIEEND